MKGVVHLRLAVATVLFGSYLVAGKLILQEVPVFTATFVRLVSAALVLSCYVWFTGARPVGRPAPRDRLLLVVHAVFGVFLFSIFAMYGVRLTGAIEAGVILGLVPVSICAMAVLFLGERLTVRKTSGIVVAVLGAAGINVATATGEGAGPHAVLGALLLVCAVACEAVFVTFGRLLASPLPPAVLSLSLAILGAGMFLVPAAVESGWGRELLDVSWQTWLLMIYSGVAINGVAAVLTYDSLDRVDAAVVAAYTALTPVSGAVLSVLLLGEALHWYHVAGMLFAVAGVYVVASAAEPSGSAPRDRPTREPVRPPRRQARSSRAA